MKKTCNNCKALNQEPGFCYLGYSIQCKKVNIRINEWRPMEECPKPRTYNEYIVQQELKIKEDQK